MHLRNHSIAHKIFSLASGNSWQPWRWFYRRRFSSTSTGSRHPSPLFLCGNLRDRTPSKQTQIARKNPKAATSKLLTKLQLQKKLTSISSLKPHPLKLPKSKSFSIETILNRSNLQSWKSGNSIVTIQDRPTLQKLQVGETRPGSQRESQKPRRTRQFPQKSENTHLLFQKRLKGGEQSQAVHLLLLLLL